MQSIPEQIFIGVVGGVLTSAFIYLVGLLFIRVMLPWYRRATYGGVNVEGSWEYRYDQPGDFGSMVLQLRQNAHQLSGDAAVTVRNQVAEKSMIFEVNGKLWEGYTSFILQSKDRRMIAFATLLLKVTNNGARMEGMYTFREPNTDRVIAKEFFLNRK